MTTYTGTSQDVTLSTGNDVLAETGVIKSVSATAVSGNAAGTISFVNRGFIYGANTIGGGPISSIYNNGTIQATFIAISSTIRLLQNNGDIIGRTDIRNTVGSSTYVSNYVDATIRNYNAMQSILFSAVGTRFTLTNTGRIQSDGAYSSLRISDSNSATVSNSGTIDGTSATVSSGAIEFGAGTLTANVVNNGTIVGSYGIVSAAGAQSFRNYNTIIGGQNGFVLSGGAATIYNSGSITGQALSAIKSTTALSITNDGTIRGAVYAIEASNAANTIINNGLISGAILLGGGNDFYDGSYGRTTKQINLGDGLNTAFGGAFADDILGGANADEIHGGGGADTLQGGAGNDELHGDEGADVVQGGANDDIVDGGDGNDLVEGGAGNDMLYGGDGADVLNGNEDNDTLDGGTGADTMRGGTGFDTYYVDNARDKVIEAVGEGIDSVIASVSYVLTAGQEIETLIADRAIGALAINLTGNEFDNDIWGNEETNRLVGGGGNDMLRGYGGTDYFDGGDGFDTVSFTTSVNGAGVTVNLTAQGSNGSYATGTILNSVEGVIGTRYEDSITGDASVNEFYGLIGNDRLDGKGGADRMYGGAGNDTYYVDVAGDLAVEVENGVDQGGIDTVYSTATTYQIGAAIESLRLLGAADIAGDGNSGANTIYGNTGANVLRGLAGADTIHGGAGGDTLVGGADRDTLFGEAGADTFTFAAGDSGITATTYDLVQDFVHADGDRIDLDIVGTGGSVTLTDANYAERTVTSDAFGTALTAANSAMADGLHNVIFVAGSTVGWLFWNTDGNLQTPDQSARLSGVSNVGLFDRTDIV